MREVLIFFTNKERNEMAKNDDQNTELIPDLTDAEEARKAFIASEIFNRKY